MAWRKKALNRREGPYWLLERGSRDSIQRITLGYATEAEAENARQTLEDDEKVTWVANSAAGPVETSLTHADYVVCLWTTGKPPFPGADLDDICRQGPVPDEGRLEHARKSVLSRLRDQGWDWKRLERLCGDAETPARLMSVKDYLDHKFPQAAGEPQSYSEWRRATKPSSWRTEKGYWERINRPRPEGLGDVALGEIDSHNVADYLDGLKIERARPKEGVQVGDPVSGATKRLHRSALQAVLKRAKRLRHIDAIPDIAEFEIEGSTEKVREQADPLSLDEVVKVLDAAPSEKHRALFGMGIGEGLRPSELVALNWEHLNLDDETVRIEGRDPHEDDEEDETPKRRVKKKGKTKWATTTIPLTPLALAEVRTWWEICGQPKTGIMFPSSYGSAKNYTTQRYEPSGYKRSLETACKKAGVWHDWDENKGESPADARRITPYMLRHTAATICWTLGIDKDTCRRILRHADETMLDRVYARPRPGDIAKRLQAFKLPAAKVQAESPAPAPVPVVETPRPRRRDL